MKMKNAVACLLTLIVALMVVTPVSAVKPSVVDCYFRAATKADLDYGEFWWTGGDTILHVRGLTKLMALFYGPTLKIGEAIVTLDYDFNTKTGKGNFVRTWEITFFEPVIFPSMKPAGIPNPYGIGTLEGKEVGEATRIFFQLGGGTSLSLSDFTGKLVATHGTGDFEKAKLTADTLGFPLPPPPKVPLFVTIDVGGSLAEPTGELTFH
jgi:hypothetical protein